MKLIKYNNIVLTETQAKQFQATITKSLISGGNIYNSVTKAAPKFGLLEHSTEALKAFYYDCNKKFGKLCSYTKQGNLWLLTELGINTLGPQQTFVSNYPRLSSNKDEHKLVKDVAPESPASNAVELAQKNPVQAKLLERLSKSKDSDNDLAYLSIEVQGINIRIQFNVD